jgi:spermidine synthase
MENGSHFKKANLQLEKFLFILFFSSGISGLIYEVVWLRMLSRIMGVTIHATSTVLASFMAGLALGSFLFGKFIDKREDHLKTYAILELSIGIAALLTPIFFYISLPLYNFIYHVSGENNFVIIVFRAVVSFIILLIPTTMMGGTIPILTSWLVKI